MIKRINILLLLGLFAFMPQCALSTDAVAEAAQEEKNADEKDEKIVLGDEVAKKALPHCVRVRLWLQKHEGRDPDRFDHDRENERPALLGGYLLDKDTVIMGDPILHDVFIQRIEVEAEGNVTSARIKAYYPQHRAILLEIEKAIPDTTPITFVAPPERKKLGSMRILHYHWQEGEWMLSIAGSVQGFTHSEQSGDYLWGPAVGLLINKDGEVCGVKFDKRLTLADNDTLPWTGDALKQTPLLTHTEKTKHIETLKELMSQCALGVRFQFRSEVDEEHGMSRSPYRSRRSRSGRRNGSKDAESEEHATGFHFGDNLLLVPSDMPRESIARIESIEILQPDGGTPRTGTFIGALRDYEGILVKVDGTPLPKQLSFAAGTTLPPETLFLKGNIDYSLGKRKERFAYDRFRGLFRSYKDIPAFWTYTNESDGSVALNTKLEVVGLSLAARMQPTADQYRRTSTPSSFRPVTIIQPLLSGNDTIDKTIRPVAKEEEKRLVTLGVEWQPLTVELAGFFNARKQTRGGQIGLLVQYVYPGSHAQKHGLQSGDILLSIKDERHEEPVELKPGYSRPSYSMRHFQFGGRFSPMGHFPPWPDRRNALTKLLTDIGENHEITIQYLHKGEEKSFTMTTDNSARDYWSALKEKNKLLDLTVKEITYEVRRFYKLAESDAGVIISKVEPGGKAGVAGMMPFQRITHVNGQVITGLSDFKTKLESALQDPTASVEFTLEQYGKTRLVKIDPAEPMNGNNK